MLTLFSQLPWEGALCVLSGHVAMWPPGGSLLSGLVPLSWMTRPGWGSHPASSGSVSWLLYPGGGTVLCEIGQPPAMRAVPGGWTQPPPRKLYSSPGPLCTALPLPHPRAAGPACRRPGRDGSTWLMRRWVGSWLPVVCLVPSSARRGGARPL